MLNISLDDFKNLFNLHWCDWDGYAGNQCFDLAQFWNYVLGGSPFTGATADLIYNQPQNIYTQIANTPSNFPVAGDIIVWNWPHVGVVLSADAKSVTVLEQNDPTNGSCQVKTYNYDGVIGWLHPHQLPQDQQAILDELRQARDNNWNLYQADEATIKKLNDLIDTKNTTISSLQQQVSSLETQVTNLQNSLEQTQTIAKQVPSLQEELTQAQNDRTSCLSAQETQNKTIGQLKSQLAEKLPTGFWNRVKFLLSM